MLRLGLRAESNKTGTNAPLARHISGANEMDFRETERVETNDVATVELTKTDAPAAPESKAEAPAATPAKLLPIPRTRSQTGPVTVRPPCGRRC